jgi:hypothetical protein
MSSRKTHLIIVAPAGPTRERLEAFFSSRAQVVASLAREQTIQRQLLVIEDRRVLWDGADLLDAAEVALVLDSGYMWPLPLLDPTPEQWIEQSGRFDDYLRDDRESASLWFSLLEIINDRVPCCVNPQAAFALAAMKPDTFELLRAGGVKIPPTITTNDPEAIAGFADAHRGPLLQLPLVPGPGPQWLDRTTLADLPLERTPVMLQALAGREEQRVLAVGLQALPALDREPVPKEIAATLGPILERLELGWAELVFRATDDGWALSDFSPAPEIGSLDPDRAERALAALWELIPDGLPWLRRAPPPESR